jgi:hypothetical protein
MFTEHFYIVIFKQSLAALTSGANRPLELSILWQ